MTNKNKQKQSVQNYLDQAELRFQSDMEHERYLTERANSSTPETSKSRKASKVQLIGAGALTLIALGGGGKALLQQAEQHLGPIGGQANAELVNPNATKSIDNAGGIQGGSYTPNPNELSAEQRNQLAETSGQQNP